MKKTLKNLAFISSIFFLPLLPKLILAQAAVSASQTLTASIAVQNLSHHDLFLHCILQSNSQFFAYSTESEHTFLFHHDKNESEDENSSIDIKQINGLQSPFPNLICEENPQNGFSYRILFPDEEALIPYGHFQYDSSYPGSVLYRDESP